MDTTTPKILLPVDREPVIRVIPMPRDSNSAGDVFGGWIMSQVDLAGSVAAVAHARGRVVTVSVNSFVFKEPVFVGDLCSFYAQIEHVGRTSMKIYVEVYSQRSLHPDKVVKVTEAYITYVAVDQDRVPRPVAPLD
ncbi:MAG: acyl-CoA thioesterase [Limnobacter sp.]|nr:acyl-CoA thioesterase [Limnobacter sp.]